MIRSPQRRLHLSVAVLLLVLAFLALPAGASPRDGSFFSSPWSLLSALWEDIGLEVDPGGQPSDYGAVVDPSGGTAPRILLGNYGAIADPNGQPAAIGTEADPGGQPNH